MRRLATICALAALCAALPAAPASAAFGISEADVVFSNEDGSAAIGAGAHPFAFTTTVAFNTKEDPALGHPIPDQDPRDLTVFQIPGLAGAPDAVPACDTADFLAAGGSCAAASQLGTIEAEYHQPGEIEKAAVYRISAPPGVAMRIGFHISVAAITVDLRIEEEPPYRVIASLTDIPQVVGVYSSVLSVWGVPADPAHDSERRGPGCAVGCAAGVSPQPFLTAPRACRGPLATYFRASSWQGGFDAPPPVLTHDDATPPGPLGFTGCGRLGFGPSISARPTSTAASAPSGLDFSLEVPNPGLLNTSYEATANSDIEKTVVTLPKGMTLNPSQAEGLGVCTEADLARESAGSAFGAGCPAASKIGTIEVETPLLEGTILRGTLFVAEPYQNPFGTLIAVYVVIRDPELGIFVAQPLKVEPDPQTGQLITTAEDMPQLPFSHFRLHFREGARAPLITPPGCGSFEATAVLHPYSGGEPLTSTSSFEISSGPNGGPCQGAAPFAPGFSAGTLNNAAGRYSPLLMRLTRADGEQDISRFSAVLPPGVLGRVAGIPWCPEAGIARARQRTGPGGAAEELAEPSCPAASQIGRTLAGAGVGTQLTYVGGALYLAGPLNGAPLSVVAIVPAKAGPFDAGTVVVREALGIDPITAQVAVDGRASDPIPHILKGIPLNVRDLRVYADRPGFTLNATSCEPSATLATAWGAGTALSPSGEVPVGLSSRYQAADCARLGFKPRLSLKLRGGTRRGAHPALRAVLTPRAGDANFARAAVTLPRSAFLDQAHIRTVCTRVQFAAGPGNGALCPPGSRYGYARAWTPILAEPAQGPVYLRSSNHKLPDLVIALQGPPSAAAKVELSARIDSRRGGIRTTFEQIPDFPVSRFILDMQGGKKGLVINSTGLCKEKSRARANLKGQNARKRALRPVVRAVKCKKQRKGKR